MGFPPHTNKSDNPSKLPASSPYKQLLFDDFFFFLRSLLWIVDWSYYGIIKLSIFFFFLDLYFTIYIKHPPHTNKSNNPSKLPASSPYKQLLFDFWFFFFFFFEVTPLDCRLKLLYRIIKLSNLIFFLDLYFTIYIKHQHGPMWG